MPAWTPWHGVPTGSIRDGLRQPAPAIPVHRDIGGGVSRSRRARLPLTATLLSLALASTTLLGSPAQAAPAAAQIPARDVPVAAPLSQAVPKAPKAAAADPYSV